MSEEAISRFDLLLTRAVAKLYKSHPATIALGSYELFDPPLTPTSTNFDEKKSDADDTLLWLYRNVFVSGDFDDKHSSVVIMKAQFTARGLQIARAANSDTGGISYGQLAADAVANPPIPKFVTDLVARRFVDG
jgi:hypothetical protein